MLIQVVFPAGIHLYEHAGVAGWRVQVEAGLLGRAGASVTAVCAGVTAAAAGGCLGGSRGLCMHRGGGGGPLGGLLHTQVRAPLFFPI